MQLGMIQITALLQSIAFYPNCRHIVTVMDLFFFRVGTLLGIAVIERSLLPSIKPESEKSQFALGPRITPIPIDQYISFWYFDAGQSDYQLGDLWSWE